MVSGCPLNPSSDGDQSSISDQAGHPLRGFPMMGSRAALSFLAAAAGWESVHETECSYSSCFFDVLLSCFVCCSLVVLSFVAPKL